jgi:membrane protease YdiL (CAAX protease family)
VRLDARRIVVLAVPVAVNLVMPVIYRHLARVLGAQRGYVAGFAVYWSACVAIPVTVLGPRRTAHLLVDARPPGALETAGLALPPLGGLATETLPALRASVTVDLPLVATAIAFAGTNAVAEELLWRGLFLDVFPRSRSLGWVYPSLGFGLWHLAPQQVHPAPRPLAFCAAATVLGLVNGWTARRLGGIGATTLSHAFADATGLGSFARILGREAARPRSCTASPANRWRGGSRGLFARGATTARPTENG